MSIFCDLNVCEAQSFADNLSNVKRLIKLGYQFIAITRLHNAPEKETKESKQKNPASTQVKSMKNLIERIKNEIETKPETDIIVPANFRLLSRLTIPLNNLDQVGYMRNNYFKELLLGFDLISYIPGDERVFKSLMEGKIDLDIVSFPLENKLEFRPKRETMGMGIAKEYVFEICYSVAIKSISLRKYTFHNGKHLVQNTKKGTGIIISSGGESILDFRSPADVSNLANLFDLKGSACSDVVNRNCQKAVRHSTIRRTTFKGALSVEKIVDEPCSKRKKID